MSTWLERIEYTADILYALGLNTLAEKLEKYAENKKEKQCLPQSTDTQKKK